MDLSLVEYPVPININSQYATIDIDSNPVSFDLNDQVIRCVCRVLHKYQ